LPAARPRTDGWGFTDGAARMEGLHPGDAARTDGDGFTGGAARAWTGTASPGGAVRTDGCGVTDGAAVPSARGHSATARLMP
jgi:hypothetical protein